MKYLQKSFSVGGPLPISQEDWDRIFKPTSLVDLGADYDRPFSFPVEISSVLDGTSAVTLDKSFAEKGVLMLENGGVTCCDIVASPEIIRPPRKGRKTNWPVWVRHLSGLDFKVYRCLSPESYREWVPAEWDLQGSLDTIAGNNVVAVYYWYVAASYEGAGWALFVTDEGELILGSLFHCSCADPHTEGAHSLARFKNAAELRAWSSREVQEQVAPLLRRLGK